MLWFVIVMLVVGAIAGFLARFLVPGPDPMGFWATVLLGVTGSFVGGFLSYLVFGRGQGESALQPSGIVGSIIGSTVVLLIIRSLQGTRRHGHA